jgi:protein-L-isoaspartate(D-aspartate) O-methyltransferase
MDRASERAIIRRAFAKQILAEAQVDDLRIEEAFAQVAREDYLGPGPWLIPRWVAGGPAPTPTADPTYLYIDKVVSIVAERNLNNGVPSAHAKWITAAGPKEGEHVLHIGAGTGYYTAILGRLVGGSGRVTAVELDPLLAVRAQSNLSALPNVRVVQGDGARMRFELADVIYVCAGATHPVDIWLDGLAESGRLVVPLTTNKGFRNSGSPGAVERHGAMFRFERRACDFVASWISPAAFIPCESARDERSEAVLSEAFARGGWEKVTRLFRSDEIAAERCWLRAPGWCLAYH